MKAAYLMGSLNRGGAETLVLDICNNAKDLAFDILLIHRKNGQLKDDFSKSGVDIYQIYPKHIFDISYLLKLRKTIKEHNILILHTHQVIDAWFAYLATLFMTTKVILTFHGHGINGTFISELFRKGVLTKTDLNIFVSASQKRFYENRYKNIGTNLVIPNGVDFKKFIVSNDISIRKELRLKATDLLVGCVGNFTSGRDHFTLCKFILQLKKKSISFKFIFVGKASKAEPMIYKQCFDFCQENGLGNDVYFLGTRADVPAILNQLNAFTYSTEHDTFGIAVVEAMAMGVPVFVNDWEVMREITNEGDWASIYKSKDEYDLLSKIISFLAEPAVYLKKAKKSASHVRELYSIESHLSKLEMIYKSII